jgi:hypothetical protein
MEQTTDSGCEPITRGTPHQEAPPAPRREGSDHLPAPRLSGMSFAADRGIIQDSPESGLFPQRRTTFSPCPGADGKEWCLPFHSLFRERPQLTWRSSRVWRENRSSGVKRFAPEWDNISFQGGYSIEIPMPMRSGISSASPANCLQISGEAYAKICAILLLQDIEDRKYSD